MRFSTKQIHAGQSPDPTTGAILTPIYQSTTYVQDSVDEYLSKGFSYSRTANPTVQALEAKLTILEDGAGTVCVSSGMAAINLVLISFLNAGDHAIISDVAYGGTYRVCTKVFTRFGVEFTFVDTSNPENLRKALRKNTTLILTETPANPTLKLTDIAAISEIAREHKIPHAVDSTFLTPYYQNPLALGADLVIHSTTKFLDGHNATIGGAVVSRNAELDEKVRFHQNTSGSIMAPNVAWLTLQGTKTLSVRMDAQSANAMAVAQFLESHPKVDKVCYPGLESHPQHALARSQASGFGSLAWFDVHGGVASGKALMDSVKIWSLAENLGSVESLVTHPVTMTHAAVEEAERIRVGITDGLVRLSVGLEDKDDLIEAMKEALDRLP
jgi:cystathionine gamma-lyase